MYMDSWVDLRYSECFCPLPVRGALGGGEMSQDFQRSRVVRVMMIIRVITRELQDCHGHDPSGRHMLAILHICGMDERTLVVTQRNLSKRKTTLAVVK